MLTKLSHNWFPPTAHTPTLDPQKTIRVSAREYEVLSLIAAGLTHAQAARRLRISHHTVDTYVKRLRVKLGPGNKAHLVRMAAYVTVDADRFGPVTTTDFGE